VNSKFALPGVDAATPLREAAPALLLAKAGPLFALEEAARGGADADAVHDMRVASRRLREALRLLEPLLPRKEFRRWYRRVRDVTRALGPVRDSDVFIEDFSRLAGRVGDEGRRAVTFFVGYRMGQREQELVALDGALSRLDLAESRASLERLGRSLGGADAVRPYADFAHAAVAERAAVVFGAQPVALDEANVPEQHALRIDYKRLRYAVEAFAPCYGDAFDILHATLTAFQDTLGELHDVHVFAEMVRDPARAEAARTAGVTDAGLDEVVTVLDGRARERFAAFAALAEAHPADKLLPALLLPLARRPVAAVETARDDASAEAAIAASALELPVESPVVVGDEPWAEGWDE
jgi:CHAD domain-containing protein